MEEKALNIIQWNCRSIKENVARRTELRILLQTRKPHICCISETWLSENIKTPNIKNYTRIFRKDRADREGGGLMTLIRDDIKATHVQINTNQNSNIEAQAVEIHLTHNKVKLLHVYNPDSAMNIDNLNHLIEQMGSKYILVGDLNGHHTLWDPNILQNNPCGNALSEYLLDQPTIALATEPGLATHTNSRGATSTLDLTLCSSNLVHLIEVKVMPDSGSDHFPILTKLNLTPETVIKEKRPKWKITNDRWEIWAENIEELTEVYENSEELNKAFTKSLTDAANKTFKKTAQISKTKYCKPWWTAECAKEVARRRRARRLMERRPTISNIIDFKRCAARAKRCIKRTKRETWKKFCNSLTPETPCKVVWDMIKKMNGNSIPKNIQLEEHGIPVFDNRAQANLHADNLGLIVNTPTAPITDEEKQFIIESKQTQRNTEQNSRFTMRELKECIRTLPADKSTGIDEIHNKFLKNLTKNKLTELLRLANQSYRKTEIPNSWKHSLIVPIPKHGKDLTKPENYRPISLLSCVGKVIEKMVNTRLTWMLETGNKLSTTQCGFRKRRSTEDLLVRLEHQVRSSLVNRQITITVFFDLKQAFNSVSHEHLLFKLAKAGINGNMLSWIEEFLHNRQFQFLVGNSRSDPTPMTRGLPQGSTLSPTLFNVMIADIPHPIRTKVYEYADDIALSVTTSDLQEAAELIQEAITQIEEWTIKWNLSLNPSKTKAMCFTKKRVLDQLPTLKLQHTDIEWVKTFKYLGLTFDAPTLTWKEHIEETCRQGLQRVNILKALTGTTWGADRDLLLKVYKTYIRPKLTYGIIAVASAAESRLNALNRIQNAALRVILGAKRSSPIVALQIEANVPPLIIHIKEICCRYFYKLNAQKESHPIMKEIMQDPSVENKIWTPGIFKMPFKIRTAGVMRWWNLPMEIEFEDERMPETAPWRQSPFIIHKELVEPVNKEQCIERTRTVTQVTIDERYREHLHIYTDGSKGDSSTSAAMCVPETQYHNKWKFEKGDIISIMAAELYAIVKSLEWVALNIELLTKNNFVILTDSLSSLQSLESFTNSNYKRQVNRATRIAEIITENDATITLQWVPSHVGLAGNELADQLAKEGHLLTNETPCPLGTEEVKRLVKNEKIKAWQRQYDAVKEETHIGSVKPTIGHWPWATFKNRPTETAVARLRIGHTILNESMHRFNQADSPLCNRCSTPESIEHYLMTCRRFEQERRKLFLSIRNAGIQNISVKTVLGGDSLSQQEQNHIAAALETYLKASGRLYGMSNN